MSDNVKIKRVLELQELLKSGAFKVSYVAEKSNVNKMTISNLKNGNVDPKKMTSNTLTKLSNFMSSPDNKNSGGNHREYVFGELLALTELVTSKLRNGRMLTQSEVSNFSNKPMSSYTKMHANIVDGVPNLYLEYRDEFSHIMNKFSFDEFSDEPLTGAYLLGYYHKSAELKTDPKYYENFINQKF